MSKSSNVKLRARNRAGRPVLPKDQRKVRISLTLSKNALDAVERARGRVSRSTFVESALTGSAPLQSTDVRFDRRANGAVYTPASFADHVAAKVVQYFLKDLEGEELKSKLHGCSSLAKTAWRILDPACGDGQLLHATWNQLLLQMLSAHEMLPDRRRNFNPIKLLCGIDIDAKAIRHTRRRIAELAGQKSRRTAGFNLLKSNALFPFNFSNSAKGWDRTKRLFGAPDGFDIVIANPPWGADVSKYKTRLANGDFSLCKGQFDTADLFVELAISVARPGGYIAMILPDSLFSMERTRLRELLLRRTQIRFIGRFGEKIFAGVNRACAVVVCKKSNESSNNMTDCMRLTHDVRQQIMSGTLTFSAAEDTLKHEVPQARFIANKDFSFDIDVKVGEEHVIRCYRMAGSSFRDHLRSDRGVELSKNGWVYCCDQCHRWMPLPFAPEAICQHCRSKIKVNRDRAVAIVSEQPIDKYSHILVGENVRRYALTHHLWIETTKEGLNYKDPSIYKSPKIVVRKTGVGISATIDYAGLLTNQVVYILRQKEDHADAIPLEFFLGVLNSRAMYYYLVKSHGETEWRSHPYITQNQILDLPLPTVESINDGKWETVHSIAKHLKPFVRKNHGVPPRIDAQIEKLVAHLFGLSKEDYGRIYSTLDNVQELVPVRALKSVRISDIFD